MRNFIHCTPQRRRIFVVVYELFKIRPFAASFFSCFNLSRVFTALIISVDWGNVGCLTLFLRSGACFYITGRKASYQADNALVGSGTLNTAANGA